MVSVKIHFVELDVNLLQKKKKKKKKKKIIDLSYIHQNSARFRTSGAGRALQRVFVTIPFGSPGKVECSSQGRV